MTMCKCIKCQGTIISNKHLDKNKSICSYCKNTGKIFCNACSLKCIASDCECRCHNAYINRKGEIE